MEQLIMRPGIYAFDTCREFASAFDLGREDLVLTNRFLYEPYFSRLGLEVHTIYQEAYGAGEPSDVMVERILKDAGEIGPYRRIIAIGGGTVIDIAKAMAVAEPGDCLDALYDAMPNLERRHELVIIPTTCGTGSEMTNISVMNRTRMGTKMGLVGEAMYAGSAVLIPELLQGLPFGVFATSSIDALVHAVESALSPHATPYTRLFSYRAIEMIIRGYQTIAEAGPESRQSLLGSFLTASNYAGIAFGTAGCGTVHAMAYPLGGQYHVAHGESNYAVFTGVMKTYMERSPGGELQHLNSVLAELLQCGQEEVYERLEELLNHILPKKRLREYGVQPEDLGPFARSVMENQQRLLKNSLIPVSAELIEGIYRSLY